MSEQQKKVKEEISATPRVTRSVTRKNLLAALTGSGADREDAVTTVEKAVQFPEPLLPAGSAVLSIAEQKELDRLKKEREKMERNLENLSDRVDTIKQKLFRMKEALGTMDNVHYLNLQLQTLQRCNEEFDTLHSEIVALVKKEDKVKWNQEYLNFEALHGELYVNVQTKIANLQKADSNRALTLNASASEFLPRTQVVQNVPHLNVPLPSFDGAPENWYAFKCMFQTVMGRYPNESPAIKLYHLKNSLVGRAAGKIDQDVINNNDYESAWQLLEDTYEDERLIIDTHIDALLDLPKLTRENGDEMRKLVETCTKHVDALKNRELPVEGLSEMILVNLISKRLDRESRKLWETSLVRGDLPSFDDLIDFLKDRSRVLQRLPSNASTSQSQAAPRAPGQQQVVAKPRQTKLFVQTNKESCPCCSSSHPVFKCPEFRKLPVGERFEKVKKAGMCYNCLKPQHRADACASTQHCKTCGKPHHSLLHSERPENPKKHTEPDQPKNPVDAEKQEETPAAPEQRTVSCCTQTQAAQKQIFLSTAKIVVFGSGNATTTCRALLDCCSESNIITERLARKLNMQMLEMKPPITICGLNGMKTTANKIVQTKVSSRVGDFTAVLDFIVTPSITELPTGKVETHTWPLPAGIELADPTFNVPDDVDVIIGAELFYDVLKKGRVKIGGDFPTLAETAFGWVVSGPARTKLPAGQRRVCQLATTFEDVNRTLSKFWELESGYFSSKMTVTERAVEKHFEETHSRNAEGRYVVRLPFNELKSQLGDSYENAKRRFGRLMVGLTKNPSKREAYTQFMKEYVALGHMKEVNHSPEEGYFLPHHAVYKEASSTTKVRVVFDASAATTTGVSLNDTQLVGPTVQSDLVTIMLRFCTHQVVLTADVPKMYRQVQVHPDDRKYQRILWLNDANEMATFELATVTYGCSSAPYLATKALTQLASDEADKFPKAVRVVKEDSYIDDFLTGGKTAADVVEIYEQLKDMLSRGGFGVHKFCSNSAEVLKHIPAELQEKLVDFETSEINDTIKTLGLIWNPNYDYFTFNVPHLVLKGSRPTKKIVLSEIGKLFDPLGFLGPVVTKAKLMMQKLWELKLGWDTELPDEQMQRWLVFREQLVLVRNIKKRRCVIPADAKKLELLGYCDASKAAYGAVLYVKSELKHGTINIQPVCSKSRVAPLKPTTIPRLEACGMVVLAELTHKTLGALNVKFDRVRLFSDSMICLNWLKKSPAQLNEFVCNRVATIVELTQNYEWGFVRSENNPADSLSRGLDPEELIDDELWWDCDPNQRQPSDTSEAEVPELADEDLPELRSAKVVLAVTVEKPCTNFNRLSNINRLYRAWAYVWRFIEITRSKKRNPPSNPLTASELSRATTTIVKIIQQEAFTEEIKQLRTGQAKRNKLSSLAPFLDGDGLIRVGGRLKYSNIPYAGKHQILLPEKHPFVTLLVRHLHELNLHVGQNALVSMIRQQYWPIKVKNTVKRVTFDCVICFKHRPPQVHQPMGELPSYRVTPAPVFASTGVDFAGPFTLRESGRKPKFYKAYVAVFVCMAVKAVHLELCTDLRTETFLAALQRFTSRRGLPSNLHSDNATTFVGAKNELAELRELFENQVHKDKLADFCSSKGITWHFIPPRSPHFGGIWEAGVKAMKYLLKRVVGETRLTYEEMTTFLAQAEATMNSRPMCPLSDDPNDLQALTPSHFLIGRPAHALPEPSYEQEKIGRLSRWQHVQYMREHFWKRWSADYLHTLQQRQKWKDGVLDIKVGALVLLREENIPPQQWKKGRITATHPGEDGVVRVVTVKTASSEYKRAVTRICLFPDVDSNDPTGGV